MPLRFENSTVQTLFWCCFALFLAATAAYLALAFFKRRERNFVRPLPMLFFGLALSNLAPQFPLVYSACFLMAIAQLRSVKDDPYIFTVGAAVLICAHSLLLAQIVSALSYPVPAYAWIIVSIFVALVGVGGCFLRGKENPVRAAARSAYSCFPLLDLIFAVMLLVDTLVLGGLYLLMGCVFFTAGDIIDRVAEIKKYPRRDFAAETPAIIGQVCMYIGLVLAIMA